MENNSAEKLQGELKAERQNLQDVQEAYAQRGNTIRKIEQHVAALSIKITMTLISTRALYHHIFRLDRSIRFDKSFFIKNPADKMFIWGLVSLSTDC